MVWIVDNWEDFERQAGGGRGLGTYQYREAVDGWEARVRCGKLGYIKTFAKEEDPEFKRIAKWVVAQGYIKIEKTVPDEVFHL